MINKICFEDLVSKVRSLMAFSVGAEVKYLLDLSNEMFFLLDNLENIKYGKIKDKNIVNIKDYKNKHYI